MNRRSFLRASTASLLAARARAAQSPAVEWRYYGGDPAATRYSPLEQINRSNIGKLRAVWSHHTGDSLSRPATTMQATPLVIDGVMYVTTARLKVRALDPTSGKERWTFDPFENVRSGRSRGVNRGVSYWGGGTDERLFVVAWNNLLAVNAKDGKAIDSFGTGGAVDLRQDFDREIGGLMVQATTPGPVYKDLLIVGSGGGEGPQPAAPGHIRAYDVRTGKRRWIFHTIPHPGEFGHDTWGGDSWKTSGGANCWGGMSVDEKRGLVFAATGSPTFDFYGGQRKGKNLFGNCVIALKAETGEYVWHFQTVHHDIWDYDIPCQPALVTVRHNGRMVDAVAQVSKTGWVYLLHRETGKPLFPIEERPVPKSDLEGEEPWPTQPFPTKPPAFSRQGFTEDDVTGISPEAHADVLKRFKASAGGKMFTPPSKRGTVIMPGFHGGAIWGGGSFDPESGRLFVSSNNVPWIMTMKDAEPGRSFPYDHTGYHRFEDPDGYPAVKPPWGQLTAIDLNKGEIVWQSVLGEHEELTAKGIPQTGTENLGGSIVTKGGLVFIAATKDEKFRAFDVDTGKVAWETRLPAGGYATPSTYEVGGRQYVAIACGGAGKGATKSGDEFVAFALEER